MDIICQVSEKRAALAARPGLSHSKYQSSRRLICSGPTFRAISR